MSWFGTNLNESFSSLKGQIVSLTKEVLAEGEEEQIGAQAEPTLVTESTGYIKQIQSLQYAKAELESRLSATELECRRKVSALETKLSVIERDNQNSKEKSEDWNWELQHGNVEKDDKSKETSLLERPHRSTAEQDAVVEKLQSELKHLLQKFEEAESERNRSLSDMLQLDSQHQQALEIVCSKKAELENDLLKANDQLSKCDDTINGLQSVIQRNESDVDNYQATVDNDTKDSTIADLMTQNQNLLTEKLSLQAKLESSLEKSVGDARLKDDDFLQLQMDLEKANLHVKELNDEKTVTTDENDKLKNYFERDLQNLNLKLDAAITAKKEAVDNSQQKEIQNKKEIACFKDKVEEAELKILKYEAVMEEQYSENEIIRNKYHEQLKCNQTLADLNAANESQVKGDNDNNQTALVYLQQLMKNCNLNTIDELPAAIDEKDSEIARLRCERDKLQEELVTTADHLRDARLVLDDFETDKLVLEGECEELRDQLEELQYGKREEPEGSISRQLTTIEEEETDPSDDQARNSSESSTLDRADDLSARKDRICQFKNEISSLNEKCRKLQDEISLLKSKDVPNSTKDRDDEVSIPESTSGNDPEIQPLHSKKQLTDTNFLRSQIIFKDDQIDHLRSTVSEIGQFFGIDEYNLRETYCAAKREATQMKSKAADQDKKIETLSNNLKTSQQDLNAVQHQYGDNIRQKDVLQTYLNDAMKEKEKLHQDNVSTKEMVQKSKAINTQMERKIVELERLLQDEKNKNVEQSTQEYLTTEPLRRENIQLTEAHQCLMAEYTALGVANNSLKEKINNIQLEKTQLVTNYDNSLTTRNQECFQLNRTITDLKSEIAKLQDPSTNEAISTYRSTVATLDGIISDATVKYRVLEANHDELKARMAEQELSIQCKVEEQQEFTRQKGDDIRSLNNRVELLLKEKTQQMEILQLEEKKNVILEAEVIRLATELNERKQDSSLQQAIRDETDGKISQATNSLEAKTKELFDAHRNVLKNEAELGRLEDSIKSLKNENEQLGKANSAFNSQYEVVSKELLASQGKERHLHAECDRLKQHMVSIEESYTNEAVQAEQRESALKQTIAKLHEKMSSHSNLYSSTNQKNADRVESLQESLKNAILGRDEAMQKLKDVEESYLHSELSLQNLNHVMLEFQKSHRKDVKETTLRERREVQKERDKVSELEQQAISHQKKIGELEGSCSLNQELHKEIQAKETNIAGLQSQLNAMQQVVIKNQDQVQLLKSSTEVKVEKNLVRNLFVGYFASAPDKQREVLHIIAQILDFSPSERVRTGLDSNTNSWLTSVANFLAPPPSNIRITSKVDLLDHSSLSQAFIRFLEDESAVRPFAKLPAIDMAEETSQKALKKAQSKAGENFSSAGSSTTSFSPLIDTPLTTLQPVVLQAVGTPSTSEGQSNVSEQKYLKNLLSDGEDSVDNS